MTTTYTTSWSFMGGNSQKRFSTAKAETENGKIISINIIKSFATLEEAEQYAKKLTKGIICK